MQGARLAGVWAELPQLLTVILMVRTEPSPMTALKMPVWAEPNPGSQNQYAPLALLVQLMRGYWESGMMAIQLPTRRMFGQSAPWAQPGSSHQSQTLGWYCREDTAFSPMAIVFE